MKRTLLIALAALVVAATGCNKRPDDVLSDSRAVDLFADLELADSYVRGESSFVTDSSRKVLRQSIMASHNVTEAQYEATMDYYGHHLDEYQKVLERTGTRLAKLQAEYDRDKISEEKAGEKQGEGLWPYGKMVMISELSPYDGIKFEITDRKTDKGDRIVWEMHLNKLANSEIILGADYEDGSTDYVVTEVYGTKNLSLTLPTDSAKEVSRLFGRLRMKNYADLPVWIDSIRLLQRRFDPDALSNQRIYKVKKDAFAD